MVERTKLDEDLSGIPVDQTQYRSMIGSLMYLTTTSINMGLWYPKDTSMALTAYADADHAGCQDTQRSTSGSAQFLGMRSQLSDYGFAYNHIPLYCDNKSAIALCWPTTFHIPGLNTSTSNNIHQKQVKKGVVDLYSTDGGYKCQLDEQWFNLTKDTLRDALQITPVNNNKAFSSPPTQDTLINFASHDNHHIGLYTGKTSEVEKARAPVLQFFGRHHSSSYRLMRKGCGKIPSHIHTFHEEKKNLAQKHTQYIETTLIVIPIWDHITDYPFTFNASTSYIQDLSLPFIFRLLKKPIMIISNTEPKEPNGSCFGMPIPNELIIDDIRGADYYDAYLKKVAKCEEVSDPDSPAPKPAKSTKPKITKQAKPVAPKPLEAWNVAKKRNLKRISAADRLEFVDEAPTEPSGHDASSSLYAELGMTKSDTESDKDEPPVVKSGAPDEGQAGPNPGIQDEGQAGPNPSNDTVSQTLSTPGEPASSTGTLSSLQHLAKDFSFGDQFFNDKPSEANNEKATTDTEAESMVSITIHQDTSIIPPMTSLVIDLASVPDSPTMHWPLPTTTSKKKKKRQGSPKIPSGSLPHPPPPPPPAGPSGTSGASGAFGLSQSPLPPPPPSNTQGGQSASTDASSSSKTAASVEYTAWIMTDIELSHRSHQFLKNFIWVTILLPTNKHTHPVASALMSTYTPLPEKSLLAQISDMTTFMDWYCKKQGISELTQQDLEGPAYEIVKVFHPDIVNLQFQMEECHKLLTDQVDDAILRPALLISKMKAAYYPDVGLEQMVPDQIWIEEECKYDVAAMYGISHCVDRIEVFRNVWYQYMKKLVLIRRADLKEYVIVERDFKYLYPSDFEDMYLLNLQEDFQLGIKSYQTQLNLTKLDGNAKGFEYKHDFTVNDSPRAVMFRDKYWVKMIMRFNEIHKFSDGTLHQIDEALDYRVKEFRVNRRNPTYLPESGKLCWWQDKRRRLPTAEEEYE
ncbi:hypothetical protein Tco_1154471 [Tanacetum coccineum]